MIEAMTRESLDELILGKRLPLFVVETLKTNNVERLCELTSRTELSNAIEINLNPIQISKFRSLILEDTKRDPQFVAERDKVLVEREKSATWSELDLQLEQEKLTLEYINALLLDDDARLTPGAKRKLEQSKSMHQSRANRLKSLLNRLSTVSMPSTGCKLSMEVVNLRKRKQRRTLTKISWRYPEVEEETKPSIEGYAARFTRHFDVFYERVCCSTGCRRHFASEEAEETEGTDALLAEAKVCEEPDSISKVTGLPSPLLQPYLRRPLQVQYHWHGRLVHSLASLCAAVRDYNQRDEGLHLEAAYLRSETASVMRLGKHGCWKMYFHLRKTLHQRHVELWTARRQQIDQAHTLHETLRGWNHEAVEYNLYLRSNIDLDQTRYLTRAGLYAVDLDAQQSIHSLIEEDAHVLRSYLTVRVAHPECDLVQPEDDGGVSYKVRVLTALTRV